MAKLFGFSIEDSEEKSKSIISPVPPTDEDGVDYYIQSGFYGQYVDIEGVQGKDQDKMAISFSKDYMTVEGQQNYDDIVSDGKLDDNDINQLII